MRIVFARWSALTPTRSSFAPIITLISALFAFASLSAQPANAPRPPPHLAFAYPAGAMRGATVTLTLGGEHLADATLVHLNGPGISARITGYERPLNQREAVDLREQAEQLRNKRRYHPNQFTAADAKKLTEVQDTLARRNPNPKTPALAESVTLELTVAADAPLGARELRLATTTGLSNPLVFEVGTLPEITPPVVTATSAGQRKGAQQTATQRSAPLDVTLPAIVNGQILPGEIDTLRFTARRGQQLTCVLHARALIPYLADAVPGWFQAVLHLRDAHGREIAFNDDFQFRPDPVIGCEIPADGTYELEIHDAIYRGREDFVYRVTLGELPFIRSVFPLGAPRGQPVTLALTGWNLPAPTLELPAPTSPAGTMLLSVRRDAHPSNQIRFAIGDTPEITEPAQPATPPPLLPLPTVANGRIAAPDERDTYRFTGHAGQPIVAEIFARRLDSPLDSLLELHAPDGHHLARNDDTEDKAEGLLTHQADSRLATTLPADGVYTLTVADTQHRGGPEFGYRLAVHTAAPDFALRVTPSAVNLPAGGSALVTVFALRHDGFDGPIDLALDAPNNGLRLSGARIPAGADSVQLTLSAHPSLAPSAPLPLALHGTATLAGRSVTHAAAACDDTMQAFLWRHLVPAAQWLAQITPRAPGLRIASPEIARLAPAQPLTVKIELAPPSPAYDALAAELINPPPGLSITASRLRGRTLELTLTAESLPPAGQRAGNLIFSISGTRANRSAKADTKNAAKPRPLGLAPALPYEYVTAAR
ncbi:MAG: hypothetical protein HZA32_04485 [Opitutae bacterium]|nr:hypothetical protein [Opitutae bacterium]